MLLVELDPLSTASPSIKQIDLYQGILGQSPLFLEVLRRARQLCIPGNSAGHSGRKRPPSPVEIGHPFWLKPDTPAGKARKGVGTGGATSLRLWGNAPVAAENVLGEAYIVVGAGVMWTGRRAVQAQWSGA